MANSSTINLPFSTSTPHDAIDPLFSKVPLHCVILYSVHISGIHIYCFAFTLGEIAYCNSHTYHFPRCYFQRTLHTLTVMFCVGHLLITTFFALTVIQPVLHNQVPSIHWDHTLCKAFGAAQAVSLAIGHNPGQVTTLTQIRYLWSTLSSHPQKHLILLFVLGLGTFRIARKPSPNNLLEVPLNTCPQYINLSSISL